MAQYQKEVLVVRGYKELLKASKNAEKATRLEMRHAFREVGDIVRAPAAQKLTAYSAKSAAGLKVRVRQRGVAVEQSLRKSSNTALQRKNYGGLQMRKALLPALREKEPEVLAEFDKALDEVARIFNS